MQADCRIRGVKTTAPAPAVTGQPRALQLLVAAAVIARSFERIHRSNLVGMGVLPLQFKAGECAAPRDHRPTSDSFAGIGGDIKPQQEVTLVIERKHGDRHEVKLSLRVDTSTEVDDYRNGGILPYVLRELLPARTPFVPVR